MLLGKQKPETTTRKGNRAYTEVNLCTSSCFCHPEAFIWRVLLPWQQFPSHTHLRTKPKGVTRARSAAVFLSSGWGVRAGGRRRKRRKVGGFNGVHFPASPRVLPLHSPRTARSRRRQSTHTMFGRPSASRLLFSLSEVPKGHPGEGGKGRKRFWVSVCHCSAEKGAVRARAESRRQRAQRRTMSSQPGHCVHPPPALPSRPRPQTPKIAPRPHRARKQPPPSFTGQTRAGKPG